MKQIHKINKMLKIVMRFSTKKFLAAQNVGLISLKYNEKNQLFTT